MSDGFQDPAPDNVDPREKLVREAAQNLSEHFDTVMIFANVYEPTTEGGTLNISHGVGNWFARYGQVRAWTIRAEETERIFARKNNE